MPTYTTTPAPNESCHLLTDAEAVRSGRPMVATRCGLWVVRGTRAVEAESPPSTLCQICSMGDADLAAAKAAMSKAFPHSFGGS